MENQLDVMEVIGTIKDKFEIKLYSVDGICKVKMEAYPSYRPKESKLVLFEGNVIPGGPYAAEIWWAPNNRIGGTDVIIGEQIWDTNKVWGANYYTAALISKNSNGPIKGEYVTIVSTPLTEMD